jgi:hypothetical protein
VLSREAEVCTQCSLLTNKPKKMTRKQENNDLSLSRECRAEKEDALYRSCDWQAVPEKENKTRA